MRVPSRVRGERLNPPAAPTDARSPTVGFASCRQRTPFGLWAPPRLEVHPKSWTVNNRYLHVLSSVLRRAQTV